MRILGVVFAFTPGTVVVLRHDATIEGARRLRARDGRTAAHLFLSGCGAPQVGERSHNPHGMTDDALIAMLDGVAVSAGSACNSHMREPSYVLRAMGVPTDLAFASLRFSLGRPTSESDIDHTIETVIAGVKKLRSVKIRR